MKRITCRLLTLLTVVICGVSSAANKPSLCFITNWCNGEQEDVPLVAELRKHGFHIDNVEFHKLTADNKCQHVEHIIRAHIKNGTAIPLEKIRLILFNFGNALFILTFAGWKPPAVGRKSKIFFPGRGAPR